MTDIEQAIEQMGKEEFSKIINSSMPCGYIYLLNPAFWQALGKARGWEHQHHLFESGKVKDWPFECGLCGQKFPEKTPRPREDYCEADDWRHNWHRFIDHLAEGKDAESFFATLE